MLLPCAKITKFQNNFSDCSMLSFNVSRGTDRLFITVEYTSVEDFVQYNISFETAGGRSEVFPLSDGEELITGLSRAEEVNITATSSDECEVTGTLSTTTGY